MLKELLMSSIQFYCLSEAIYNEARGESYDEMVKVGVVIHNRSIDGRWGDTYCDVVEAPYQFSYLNGTSGVGSVPMNNKSALDRVMKAAYSVYTLDKRPYLDNILYYHTDEVSPNWDYSKIIHLTDHDGTHVYYADR